VAALFSIADATGADAFGMVIATLLERPEVAVRTADNKLVTALMLTFREFNDNVGDEMAALKAYEIIEAFRSAFQTLARGAGRPYPDD